ncbi:MAG: tyrosine-type recombinase/integrase [Pirellulaceae bacterium]
MLKKRKPAYTHHKPTGQARVRIDGKDHYLGPYGSPESRDKYDDLVAEWIVKNDLSGYKLTVDDLCLKFLDFADQYYRRKDGSPTGTIHNVRYAFRYLVRLFGTSRVREFGPRKLKAVRDAMIEDGRCRTDINRLVHWIRRAFQWGVEEEIVPVGVYQSLRAVAGLKAGRSTARESKPVELIPDEMVDVTLRHLPSVVADMVRFQRLTGCRPGEVCSIRPRDVDRSSEVWRYTLESHKSEHHGRQRVIMIGPKAQAVLAPYLLRDASTCCFSPADSERKRFEVLHEQRKTPISCGNRPGTNRRPKPKRKSRSRYTKDSYNRAIARACDKGFPPPAPLARHEKESIREWHERLTEQQLGELKEWQKQHRWSPNRLRHTASTEIRKRYGLEAAQVVLGHSTADVTQIYAERDLAKAEEIMSRIG